MFKRNEIKNAVRVVVKIGTSTLTYNNGKLNLFRIEKIKQLKLLVTEDNFSTRANVQIEKSIKNS
mgnify:CR=1 FL=1